MHGFIIHCRRYRRNIYEFVALLVLNCLHTQFYVNYLNHLYDLLVNLQVHTFVDIQHRYLPHNTTVNKLKTHTIVHFLYPIFVMVKLITTMNLSNSLQYRCTQLNIQVPTHQRIWLAELGQQF